MDVNGTLVEDKMRRFRGECAHFSFNKCLMYIHDGASAKFNANSHETDYSVVTLPPTTSSVCAHTPREKKVWEPFLTAGLRLGFYQCCGSRPGAGSGSFGPPGSVSQRSGSFYRQAKIVRKTLIPAFCVFFITFYL